MEEINVIESKLSSVEKLLSTRTREYVGKDGFHCLDFCDIYPNIFFK